MDYILFHSQYSPSSRKLFEQFPSIAEKAVSVDSTAMRMYAKKLHIICVPTLVIIMDNKIIERIMGFESISNWLMVTIYRVNRLQGLDAIEEPFQGSEMNIPEAIAPQQVTVTPDDESQEMGMDRGTTNLDSLILEDVEEVHNEDVNRPHVGMGMGVNTMQLAEAMKKERDNADPMNKKNLTRN